MLMKNGLVLHAPFTLNGTNISDCSSYIQLGREINMVNDLAPELSRRKRAGWGAFKSIEDYSGENKEHPTPCPPFRLNGTFCVNVDHLDQHDIYTLEILPDGCSNSILIRLAHCTTWPDKAVPGSGRMVLRLLKWMQALDALASVAVISGAGVGRAGTYLAIEQVCTRLFKGLDASAKVPKYRNAVSKFHSELSQVM
ncbi:unnamed protein product [Angiostrongylus costaricensis]|uniref:Tyrosine-protein phosphatase domain-containing protein n=1 Tax=Angiostrongylus costaricensis TaxID=334426 RepID=A0A0R3Q1H3_ANGCS|nr:unnamed protein product [Angiostrongylus costaricensis]